MKCIVIDSGPIITLTLNNLLSIVEPLRKQFGGSFYITNDVRRELIVKPLTTKKYKLEAMQIMPLLNSKIIEVYDNEEVNAKARWLQDIANNTFMAKENYITIVQYAEMQTLAAALLLGADAVVIDERTTRMLIENPLKVSERMRQKLHTSIRINKENLEILKQTLSSIKVIRSAELVIMAYELGAFNSYLSPEITKKSMIEGILWAVKLNGCSISDDEIKEIANLESKI